MAEVYDGQQFAHANQEVQRHTVEQAVADHVAHELEVVESLGTNPVADRTETQRTEEIVLGLSPDKDDQKIQDLLQLVTEVGVLATLKAIESTASHHIKDDLHRALVAYFHQGYPVKNLPEHNPIRQGLEMTLFELYLPVNTDEQDKQKELKQLLASMEQFLCGYATHCRGRCASQLLFYRGCPAPTTRRNCHLRCHSRQ